MRNNCSWKGRHSCTILVEHAPRAFSTLYAYSIPSLSICLLCAELCTPCGQHHIGRSPTCSFNNWSGTSGHILRMCSWTQSIVCLFLGQIVRRVGIVFHYIVTLLYCHGGDNLFVFVSPVCASGSSRIRGEPIGLVLLYLRPCACTSAGMAGRACRLGRSKFACTTRRLIMPAVVRGNRHGEPHLNMAACHILVWSSGLAVTSGHR